MKVTPAAPRLFLGGRVGVVEAQVRVASELGGHTEVELHGLGVAAQVEIENRS